SSNSACNRGCDNNYAGCTNNCNVVSVGCDNVCYNNYGSCTAGCGPNCRLACAPASPNSARCRYCDIHC
ncbi:unnamed protein product, partial [Rotaria sp. Silwood2]